MSTTVRTSTRVLVIALAAVLAMLVAAGNATPAHAWYAAGTSERPGTISLDPPMAIDEYDGYVRYLTWRTARGPLVQRSPSTTGAQDVYGIYQLQEWTPTFGWTGVTKQVTQTYRIPAGYNAVRLPALDRAPTSSRGYFRVVFVFYWFDAQTGVRLGGRSIMPNVASDHSCVTWFRPCETGAGWIRTGRLSTHGGGW